MARILIVDDSQPMRQLVEETLLKGNHEVVSAENGEDGLIQYSRQKFDLVITDINMPLMDGYGLIQSIREKEKEIPILALTTESEDHKRNSGEQIGVDGWIVKPFKPAQFLAIIKQVLS